MATEAPPKNQPAAADRRSPAAHEAAGFAALAKRISAWTSRLLVSAIVLVAGLAFARQVLRWWAEDDSKPAAALAIVPPDGLGDPGRVHALRLGSQGETCLRQTVIGGPEVAVRALQTLCRRATAQSGLPASPADKSELALLARVGGTKPVDEQPGQWRLYSLPQVCPLVVGVRLPPQAAATAGTNLAESGSRVVTWGIAVPTESQAWALYAFQPEPGSPPPSGGDAEIPLPPDCHGLLTIRVLGGGGIAGFDGGVPERAMQFYDRWFAERGWQANGWQKRGPSRCGRFVAAGECAGTVVEVCLNLDAEGRMNGLIVTTPPPRSPN